MLRILHLVNMGLRYGRSKGFRDTRQEEPPLGSLAAPCHLEESASHHLGPAVNRQPGYRRGRLAELPTTPIHVKKLVRFQRKLLVSVSLLLVFFNSIGFVKSQTIAHKEESCL